MLFRSAYDNQMVHKILHQIWLKVHIKLIQFTSVQGERFSVMNMHIHTDQHVS